MTFQIPPNFYVCALLVQANHSCVGVNVCHIALDVSLNILAAL